MADWNSLLFRDTLNDTGVIPSTGYASFSPDIIFHTQVVDPQTVFAADYTSDPNQSIKSGDFNYIYTRTKNLSTNDNVGGTIQLFWTKSSLLMNMSQWSRNRIPVLPSQPHTPSVYAATCPVVAPDALSIPDLPFYWNTPQVGPGYHYCLVGVCFPNNITFTIPTTDFTDASAFVSWIRNNQNVAWRNVQIVNVAQPSTVRLDVFHNTFEETRLVVFNLVITPNAGGASLPDGTTINLRCDALHIDSTFTIGTDNPPYTATANCPEGFDGGIQTAAHLPTGQQWPAGLTIETKALWAPPSLAEELHRFATSWAAVGLNPTDHGLTENDMLIEIGSSSDVFLPN